MLSPWRWPMRLSSPERAILEALDELPNHESFHNIDMIFQGLTNLRPRRLTSLLQACRSVKVKRLFFVFADKHKHAWLNHVDKAAVDLGSGPRALTKGGKLHPDYQVYVPADLVPAVKRRRLRLMHNLYAEQVRLLVQSCRSSPGSRPSH